MNEAVKHESPEEQNVVFETIDKTVYNPASRWKRIVAAFLDGVFVSILSLLMDKVFAFGTGDEAMTAMIISFILSTTISGIYYVVPTYKFNASPGKMLLGLKVLNIDEKAPLGLLQVILREVVYKFISAVILMMGYLYFFFNKDARALHDFLGKTIVVEEE